MTTTRIDSLPESLFAILPDEALSEICSYCSCAELKLISLTNKAFNRAANTQIELKLKDFIKRCKVEFGNDLSILVAVAAAQAKAGLVDQARKTFQSAIVAAESIEDCHDKGEALAWIAAELTKAGFVAEAKIVAKSIRNDIKAFALAIRGIAVELAKAKLFKEAIDTTTSIKHNYADIRASALRDIAVEQAKEGLAGAIPTFEAAIKAAESIEVVYMPAKMLKARTLRDIATEQAKLGLIDRARRTFEAAIKAAEAIEHAHTKEKVLAEIAKAQANAGFIDEAEVIAQSIKSIAFKASVLREVAEKRAKTRSSKEEKRAFKAPIEVEAAGSIENASIEASALRDAAVKQAKAGLIDEAKTTALRIPVFEVKKEAIIKILKVVGNFFAKRNPVTTGAVAMRSSE